MCYGFVFSSLVWAGETENFKVKDISFQGNRILKTRILKNQMLTRSPGFLSSHVFHPNVFDEDLKAIEQFYQNNGFLDVQILGYKILKDSVNHQVSLNIAVDEGEQYLVEGFSLFGNQDVSDSLLALQIVLHKNRPLTQKDLSRSFDNIVKVYHSLGYVDLQLTTELRIQTENHRAIVDFMIQENARYTIGQIRIQGIDRTRPKAVFRELRFQSGDFLNMKEIMESQRKLYLTGLFQNVFISQQPSQETETPAKDILIEVKENLAGEINTSAGFGSLDKLRCRLEILHQNISGLGRKAGIQLHASFIERSASFSLSEPWTFGTRFRTDVTLLTEQREETAFSLNRQKAMLTIGRKWGRYSNISSTWQRQAVRLNEIKVADIPASDKKNIRSVLLKYTFDSRDNIFNSKNGVYYEFSQELGGDFNTELTAFYRMIHRIKVFHSPCPSTVISSAFEVGWISAKHGIAAVPLQERFYTGGPNSIRGFKYQGAGPLDINQNPIGGQFKVVWNILELRRRVYKMAGIALFLDAGNVWTKPEQATLSSLHFCPGTGLRMDTPIGVARLDIGFKTDKTLDKIDYRVHFNIGQAF